MFPKFFDFVYIYIWERAHGMHVEREDTIWKEIGRIVYRIRPDQSDLTMLNGSMTCGYAPSAAVLNTTLGKGSPEKQCWKIP